MYILHIYIYTHTHTHTTSCLSIYLSVDTLSCFHILLLQIMLPWILGWMYLFKLEGFFSGYMSRSGIARSYGSSVFSFLRNLHTVLQSGSCPSWHSHQECRKLLFTPNPLQHLSFEDFLMITILIGMKRYLVTVLIGIFLIISSVEHLFMWLLTILYIFFGEMSI